MKRKLSHRAQQKRAVYPENQLNFLNNGFFSKYNLPTFEEKLKQTNFSNIPLSKLKIFQINLGYMCNQVCEHCHVDAGPDRKEIMNWETMTYCLEAIKISKPEVVDLTGGAPEMNPYFKDFILALKKLKVPEIIVRSNLTIFFANKKFADLPQFFKSNKIHIVSSLPCYTAENTDKQRGEGVFNKSIKALLLLNEMGYGADQDLILDLVYNPGGAFLPGDQKVLEKDYKKELMSNFNIRFNQLFAITNMPVSRFLDFLIASERYDDYMTTLVNSFNPKTINDLMCTNTLSVSWNGNLYDCDFNQMLELTNSSASKNIKDFNAKELSKRTIVTSQHCYGCTAGTGSSCQGTVL